jgi:hypothetical protein
VIEGGLKNSNLLTFVVAARGDFRPAVVCMDQHLFELLNGPQSDLHTHFNSHLDMHSHHERIDTFTTKALSPLLLGITIQFPFSFIFRKHLVFIIFSFLLYVTRIQVSAAAQNDE